MTKKVYKAVKYSELKKLKKIHHKEQKYTCPILELKFHNSLMCVDHVHKRKNDKIGGENNLGLIRGIIHKNVNSFEGKVTNAYKRYGLFKYIDLPTLLRNLAYYLENPPLIPLNYIHPTEAPKKEKIGKRKFNKLIKHYFKIYPNKRKLPEYPKSGKITKQLEQDFKKLEEYLDEQYAYK